MSWGLAPFLFGNHLHATQGHMISESDSRHLQSSQSPPISLESDIDDEHSQCSPSRAESVQQINLLKPFAENIEVETGEKNDYPTPRLSGGPATAHPAHFVHEDECFTPRLREVHASAHFVVTRDSAPTSEENDVTTSSTLLSDSEPSPTLRGCS